MSVETSEFKELHQFSMGYDNDLGGYLEELANLHLHPGTFKHLSREMFHQLMKDARWEIDVIGQWKQSYEPFRADKMEERRKNTE